MTKLVTSQSQLLNGSDLLDVLRRDGVVQHRNATLTPLAGGVSSEMFRVEDGTDVFIVKRALSKLRVDHEWFADVRRTGSERKFIEYVGRTLPGSVPALRPGPASREYVAMEYFGPEFVNWEELLLRGQAKIEEVNRAAHVLGCIHAYSAIDPTAPFLFNTTESFAQLRINRCLLATGRRHRDLWAAFDSESRRLSATRQCLVHGDFSPKNILVSRSRLVLFDCEAAWFGDPAFDIAFFFSHLLLKALYHGPRILGLERMIPAFWNRYSTEIEDLVEARELKVRVTRLLMMLLLAGIDGKSRIDYLTNAQQKDWVRRFTRARIMEKSYVLEDILSDWFRELEDGKTH